MAASKPTFHMYIISLYHLYRYVFVLMLTEHAQARPQFSISYLPLLKLCTDPLHRRDIDLTVIFKSGRILSSSFRCVILYLSIPIPFIMPNRLTSAPYLALLGNYAIHTYLIYLTHVPYIMMAVHQTPLSCSLLICNHCSMEHPFIQHHHLYILNYTILDFICQALNCIYLMFFQWLR